MSDVVRETTLPLPLFRKGKVREVYEVDDDALLLVTSDRISAFDVVMNEAIPHKGAVLTQMSAHWFRELRDVTDSHFISADADEIVDRVPALKEHTAVLQGRSMLARRTEPVLFECVVRGYVAGSAWKEYRASGTLAGEPLPEGLVESQQLNPPIFSPATKAESGHDENITFAEMRGGLPTELADRLRDVSLELYTTAASRMRERGIIIADTKFEFGLASDGTLLLIDEVLTPDSSRFWPADRYEPGTSQPSFDKQPLRDYLDELRRAGGWTGDPPPPTLPQEVVDATSTRYLDAYRRVTGRELDIG
jgi:phosphoribosylaminoimidazole-succinocarboxamide synthase